MHGIGPSRKDATMTPDPTPSASTGAAQGALDGPDVFASRSPWRRAVTDPHDIWRSDWPGSPFDAAGRSHQNRSGVRGGPEERHSGPSFLGEFTAGPTAVASIASAG